MKRIIKFRVWDNDDIINSTGIEILGYNPMTTKKINGIDLEWMQFTGLLDKNKVEIYEGDIVELETIFSGNYFNDGDDAYHYIYTGFVRFIPSLGFHLKVFRQLDVDNDKYMNHVKFKVITQSRSKVIGNIHENHELLK